MPSLQFGCCCVRTDCRCVALDLLFLTDLFTLSHSHAHTNCSGVHSWPVCPSLLQTEQCLQCWGHSSRWSSCLHQPLLLGQCGGQVLLLSVPHSPASQHLEVCAAMPQLSPGGDLIQLSVCQSECVGCSGGVFAAQLSSMALCVVWLQ